MSKITWQKFEVFIFYLLIFLNLIPILKAGLLISLDGPAHTYNASLIKQFITGDAQNLRNYFEFNSTIIPNWTGHSLMAFFQCFVSPRMSEKLLLISILVFTPISFRYFVKSFAGAHFIGSYLIFILTYNTFQVLGFYNFLIAFIPAFFLLGYFVRNLGEFSRRQYIVMGVLLIVIYLSHVFIYLLCLLTIFLLYAVHIGLQGGLKPSIYLKSFFRNATWLMICAVPSGILFILFSLTKPELHPIFLAKSEITNMFRNNQSLVCFTSGEIAYSRPILHALLLLSFGVFVQRIIEFIKQKKLILTDVFPVLLIILIILLYILPNGDGWGGFYTLRTLILINLFLIIWSATSRINAWFKFGAWGLMVYYHILLMINYNTVSQFSQPWLQACHKAGTFLEEGKILLPVNSTGNWIFGHSAIRAATLKKDVVALENYEATMNYFPFMWKKKVNAVPELPTGAIPADFAWWPWKTPGKRVLVDYIFSVGNVYGHVEEHFHKLGECIKNNYIEIYAESDCYLYKLKRIPE